MKTSSDAIELQLWEQKRRNLRAQRNRENLELAKRFVLLFGLVALTVGVAIALAHWIPAKG